MFGQNAEPSLRITMKIIETIGNYQHLQISGFKIVPLVAENEFVRGERTLDVDRCDWCVLILGKIRWVN